MPAPNAQSYVYFICLRLLAVIGILLIVERLSGYYLTGYSPERSTRTAFGLDVDGYKDGRKINALQNVTSIRRKSKAIVAASVKTDDVGWLHEYFPEWEINVYGENDHSHLAWEFRLTWAT